ncbi:MAG: hypothetical protein K8T89_06955 [Planctomycetes bacterium]|nr:hypothetical protein [Planctomycetota bacterium]
MRMHGMAPCLLLTGVVLVAWANHARTEPIAAPSSWEVAGDPIATPLSAERQRPSRGALFGAPEFLIPQNNRKAPAAPIVARAQWDVSGNDSITTPLPIGQDRPTSGGLFFAAEFLFIHANRNIGNQIIAQRGFRDSDGSLTGTSGQRVGSGRWALSTEYLGRTTTVPGFRVSAGYVMEDGVAITISYAHLFDAKYNASAGPIPADFDTGAQGADALLFSPVFNFSPEFAGPLNRFASFDPTTGVTTILGSGGSPYGIWNGANNMSITYTQRFDTWDIGARVPAIETDYSKSYGLAGGRFAWIWESFNWRTTATDYQGLGAGSLLYSIAKERAKYIRGDKSTQAKRARGEYTIVPNAQASVNLWWYPIKGVQMRAGYDIWTFFNTVYMNEPVSFNFGDIDPAYGHRPVRIFHGFHAGISINF